MMRKRWAWALLLVVAGYVGGLTVASSDGPADGPARPWHAPAAVAATGDMDPADVAAATMPAVVNISTDKVAETPQNHPFMDDPFFRRFFDIPDGGQQERIERSLGSGVVISQDGYILTNNHVVEKAEAIRVSFNNNEEHVAEVVGTDPQTDVALIKIDTDQDLPYLKFGDSDALRVGEEVMAIGNPFGVGQTVTKGIVSAKGRSIGLIDYEDLIQTDATINPGNSGGALVNMRGELVGMNTAILSRSGGSQGIGFAVPSKMADRILSALKEHGEVRRSWLGVTVQNIDQSIADYYGLDRPQGVLVSGVNDGTPAEKAGVKEGDVILAVDGDEVANMAQLRNKISLLPVGHEAALTVLRDGDKKTIDVELAEMPDQEQLASQGPGSGRQDEDALTGVTVRAIDGDLRAHADLPDDLSGLYVLSVDQRSNAAREGLRRGDVIVEVNKQDVGSLDDYRKALKRNEGKPVLLRVYRPSQNGRIFLAVPR